MAIFISGNDHEIAENIVGRVAEDANDAGAIYIGRDWTARGTVIRSNILCDIRAAPGFEVKGIYLDDFASGITIEDNLFLRVDQPVFIGGGRDNVIVRNVMVASSPAVTIDARGLTWARTSIDNPTSDLRKALAAMPVSSPLWQTRYPPLARILEDDPRLPKGNRIGINLVVGGVPFQRDGIPPGLHVSAPMVEITEVLPALQAARTGDDVSRILAPELVQTNLEKVAAGWPRSSVVDICSVNGNY